MSFELPFNILDCQSHGVRCVPGRLVTDEVFAERSQFDSQ
jgi:hypothetical protein